MEKYQVVIYPYQKGKKRQIKVDDILYDSRNSMMTAFGLLENDIYQFKKHCPYEEAISLAIEYRKSQNEKNIKKHENARKKYENQMTKSLAHKKQLEFIYWGRTFKTFRECVKYCEKRFFDENFVLNADSIKMQAKKHNRTLQEQLSITLKRKYVNKRKNRTHKRRYAFCYFNTKEKALKYFSYKITESYYFIDEINGKIKHVIKYIPTNECELP